MNKRNQYARPDSLSEIRNPTYGEPPMVHQVAFDDTQADLEDAQIAAVTAIDQMALARRVYSILYKQYLEYESTLELLDQEDIHATFKKRKKIRYLQDNIIAYQDEAWGDGDPRPAPALFNDPQQQGEELPAQRETQGWFVWPGTTGCWFGTGGVSRRFLTDGSGHYRR